MFSDTLSVSGGSLDAASNIDWLTQELSRLGNDNEVLSEEWSWEWFEDARRKVCVQFIACEVILQ